MELISGTIKDAQGNDFTNKSIMAKSGKWFINGKSDTFTLQEQSTGKNFWCNAGAIFNNAKIRIWGYEGTEDKPYEQYGASPSIDYPSEIKTVGSNVNLIPTDETDWEQGTIDSGTPEYSTTRIRTADYCPIKYYEQTISLVNSDSYVFRNIHYYDSNKTYINNQFALDGNKLETFTKLTFTPPATAMYFKAVIAKKDNSALTPNKIRDIKPKLEKGTIVTPYSPYHKGSVKIDVVNNDNTKSQTAIMPIQQEMLDGDYIDKDGEHHEWGKLVLTGDEKDSVFEQFNNATGLVYFRVICEWKEKNGKVVSNMLKVSSKDLSEIEQSADLIYSIVSGNEFFMMLKDSSITSVALLKAKLKELNEAGTPLTIYYEIRKDKNTNIYGDAPKTRYLLNDEQNEALTTELNAYQNITNIDASNELASVDVTYYTNNKSNKIYVKEYELKELDKQLDNKFLKLDYNIQNLKSATEYPNYFLRLISAKSTQKYTINSGEITQIQLEKFNYNGSFYGEFISVYSGMIDISRDIYLDISGAIKFYTSPKENCNISLCLLKYLYDNETESFSVKEELFSTDILKATTDSKVSAVIPSTIIYAQTNDIVGLGFKSNISGEYTIMQDPQNSFLKIRPISPIIQLPQ